MISREDVEESKFNDFIETVDMKYLEKIEDL
jgi:hypothetical protein